MLIFAIGAWFIPFRLKSSESSGKVSGAAQVQAKSRGVSGSRSRQSTLEALTSSLLPDVGATSVYDEPTNDDAFLPDMGESAEGKPFLLNPASQPSLWSELWACFSSPVYLMTSFGYAAYTAVIAGFSYYGPTYIRKRSSWGIAETEADTVFGGIVAATGLIGTALGGIVLDRCSGNAEGAERLVPALGTVLIEVIVGTAICIGAGYCETANAFFVCLALGVLVMFMTTAGVNVALMWSVPPANRATAMALSVILIHLLGDVPSPIVIGEIDRQASPQTTFLLTSSWLFWAIFCWALACCLARRRVIREKALSDSEELATEDGGSPIDRAIMSPYQRYPFTDVEEEEDEGRDTEDDMSPPQHPTQAITQHNLVTVKGWQPDTL